MGARDRDHAGRPRNARPRDELGRPLPRDTTRAGGAGPGGPVVTPAEAAGLGGQLLLDGLPFQAHEVFEDAWKAAPESDRDLWRGLAQIAVGLTHARRGNARGAVALLRRGADNLREYGGESRPYGIDVAAVRVRCGEVADLIERDGLGAVPPEALLLPLGSRLPA